MIKILEIFLTIIEKEKLRKQYQLIMEKLIFKFQENNYQHLNQRLLKSMKEISLGLKKKYFLYSKGMSTRDIQETIYQILYCDLDKDTISRITDKIIRKCLIDMWSATLKKECTHHLSIEQNF